MAGLRYRVASLIVGVLCLLYQMPARAETMLRFMPLEDAPTSETVRNRFLGGQNIQALLLFPEVVEPGAALLDPSSVEFHWNGKQLVSFTYYKTPRVALLFALVDPLVIQEEPVGTLTVTARLLGEEKPVVDFSLPLSFSQREVAQVVLAQKTRKGRFIHIQDEEGKPLAGAYLFGQRREDLFARADAEGRVILDRPARNSSPAHYAWRPDYWARRFDPLTSPTVQLVPKNAAVETFDFTPDFKASEGDGPANGLLYIGNDYYMTWSRGEKVKVEYPGGENPYVTILAAGFNPVTLTMEELKSGEVMVMEKIAKVQK